ncbi:type 1 glutamine amidotransferase [Microtetraspora niveoalba]|uniref:type 1 glutamine amidotransferase n=1 Tax=Microtetraspora niveoalba TaxID=46175 RepID=UPI0009FEE471|nr:type 1 glutamine amidotransferase [Microtetraspora niveoalba]
MRALFVQQDHVSPTGPIGERFERRGYETVEFPVVPAGRFHAPDVEVVFPDPRDYDVIVPMGAPWSVYDEATIGSWVRAELEFLRLAHESGVPVLGICFGGQALAAALGGRVERGPEPEIGWHTIETRAPGLVEAGPWFQWHHDRWSPPPGADALARTAAAPQAFTLRRSLAVQFHPELTLTMLEGWLGNGGGDWVTAHGGDVERLVAMTEEEEPAAVARAYRLVDRFLDQVAARPR